jgi:hypothetical protein
VGGRPRTRRHFFFPGGSSGLRCSGLTVMFSHEVGVQCCLSLAWLGIRPAVNYAVATMGCEPSSSQMSRTPQLSDSGLFSRSFPAFQASEGDGRTGPPTKCGSCTHSGPTGSRCSEGIMSAQIPSKLNPRPSGKKLLREVKFQTDTTVVFRRAAPTVELHRSLKQARRRRPNASRRWSSMALCGPGNPRICRTSVAEDQPQDRLLNGVLACRNRDRGIRSVDR